MHCADLSACLTYVIATSHLRPSKVTKFYRNFKMRTQLKVIGTLEGPGAQNGETSVFRNHRAVLCINFLHFIPKKYFKNLTIVKREGSHPSIGCVFLHFIPKTVSKCIFFQKSKSPPSSEYFEPYWRTVPCLFIGSKPSFLLIKEYC